MDEKLVEQSMELILCAGNGKSIVIDAVKKLLDDGNVAGIGTHDELLASCEVYQEIYYSQFKKEV